jgi:hypothetical protein
MHYARSRARITPFSFGNNCEISLLVVYRLVLATCSMAEAPSLVGACVMGIPGTEIGTFRGDWNPSLFKGRLAL